LPSCVEPQYVNNPVFAQRASTAGGPSYPETIKYIDDGLKYIDATSGFFVAPDGRMCFRGVVSGQQNHWDSFYKGVWCLAPTVVSRVEPVASSEVRVSCKHAAPQCIREIGYQYRATNTAQMWIAPAKEEKTAIEHLVYLMGGTLGDAEPFK